MDHSGKHTMQVGFIFESDGLQRSDQPVKMEDGCRRRWPSWKNLKRRMGWKRINVMGFWSCGSSNWILDNNDGEEPLMTCDDQSPAVSEMINLPEGSCIAQIPAGGGTTMNLATALAADRRQMTVGPTDVMKVKPLKSIVRLFEGLDSRDEEEEDGDGGGIGTLCCRCTERNKGASLIPCGHTYCRVCSRVMMSKRRTCPLCNRSITEILEIF